MQNEDWPSRNDDSNSQTARRSMTIDWYAEGEERTVEVDGIQVRVRFIGRKGRRGRISVVAPAGAVFRGGEDSDS